MVEVGEICEQYTIQRPEDGDELEVDVDSQSAVLDEDIGGSGDNNGIAFEESADGYSAEQEGYEEVGYCAVFCVLVKSSKLRNRINCSKVSCIHYSADVC